MEVHFFDTLAMVPLRIGQTEQTFLEKVTEMLIWTAHISNPAAAPTPVRSRKKTQCFAIHVYQIHLQYHPPPT
jgi:hypothetical protein